MLDLSRARRVIVVGGGTAGWFAGLEMRHAFAADVEVVLVESDKIGIIGAGEGSIPNFGQALQRYQIDQEPFMSQTGSTVKLGVCFDGWRQPAGADRYYHLFSTMRGETSLVDWCEQGFYPLSSHLMAGGTPLEHFPSVQDLINRKASQAETLAWLGQRPQEAFAYHFDARALARFLRAQAESRGVRRVEALVREVTLGADGNVDGIETDQGRMEADFFVDASGLGRLILGKTMGVAWESFSQNLILDAALPFMMPHTDEHPPLVTLSKAMKNGWMWVIPTQGRLGCGYVYSSAHASEDQVLRELEEEWRQEITPVNRLRFSPGRLARCLHRNVLAVGLAAGFVEPLEATSIAQTLYQLSFFGNLMRNTNWTLPDQAVDLFNLEVANAWDGIVDFLVMHYDTQRRDTDFWRDAATAVRPRRYEQLRQVFQSRTPRLPDLMPYQMGGTMLFGIASWETVGFAMGVLPAATARHQLDGLSPLAQLRLDALVRKLAISSLESSPRLS